MKILRLYYCFIPLSRIRKLEIYFKNVYLTMLLNIKTLLLIYWMLRKFKNRKQCGSKRRFWVQPIFTESSRRKYGAGSNLIPELKLNQLSSHYNFLRMTPTAFENLHSMVSSHLQKVDIRRQPISTEVRLAITLRYLAMGDSMRSLSYLFRVGFSTVSDIISETTSVIWEVLQPIVLQPPTEEEWRNIADGYKNRWQFPNCIGAIDGKHVQIEAPPNTGSEYYNYKGCHSVVLLAVVDFKCCFKLVDIGSPGRYSDGGVFLNSKIGKGIKESQLNIPEETEIIEGRPKLPFVFVGDAAFPLLKHLLRPYPARQGLGLSEQIFNYRLSRARLTVENAFGILASRWRIFRKPIIAKIENVENIIKACVCLHNYCMQQPESVIYLPPNTVDKETPDGVLIPGSWRHEEGPMSSIRRSGANNFTLEVRSVRDILKEYFNEEGSVPWQWSHVQ